MNFYYLFCSMNEIEKIKSLRNQNGISQTKMAKSIGLSQPGYAKIESGLTENISLSLAVKISNVLGVGFNELYDIDGDSQKIDSLNKEIEALKKRIAELKEQVCDKRQIIEYLTNDDIAPDFARFLRNKEEGSTPTNLDPDNLDLDALIKEVGENEEFDKNAKEYVLNVIKKLKRS